MKKFIYIVAALVAAASASSMKVNADEVSENEVVIENFDSTDFIGTGSSSESSDFQSDSVEDEENEETVENDNSSYTDDGQLIDMVEMLRHDMVTYINFSYKMQVCQVALLAMLTGGVVAVGIFNHFRR